ncbi:hypothetical protein HWV62_21116 [Athelia sp. TMB]|nr:hypothetical protein HWV62_21116 [Athelia sp. TMB]
MQSVPIQHSFELVEPDDLNEGDMVIAVMGLSGAGKSSVILANIFGKFISIAIGGAFDAIGHELEGRTRTVRAFRCWDPASQRSYVFIDTLGFDDTFLSDADILIDIARWLNTTYRRKILLQGILYLHRITDNRMSASALRNSDMFRHLCGDAGLANVILVTTMWDSVSEKTSAAQDGYLDMLERREAELREFFWQSMVNHGSQTARFHRTHESAWDVLGQLKGDPRPIQLQREMVDERKSLSGTSAGAFLKKWLDMLDKHFKPGADGLQSNLHSRIDSEQVAEPLPQNTSLVEKRKRVEIQQDRLEGQSARSAHEVSLPSRAIASTSQSNHQPRMGMLEKPYRGPFDVREVTLPRVAGEAEEIDMWRKYGQGAHGMGLSSHIGVSSYKETDTEPEAYQSGSYVYVESANTSHQTAGYPSGPHIDGIDTYLLDESFTHAQSEQPRDPPSTLHGLDPQEVADEESVSIEAINSKASAIQRPQAPPVNLSHGRKPRTAALRLWEKAQSQLRSSKRRTEDLSDLKRGMFSGEQQDLPKLKTYAASIHSQATPASYSQNSSPRPESPFLNTASSSSAPDSAISMSSRISKFLRTPKNFDLLTDRSAPRSDNQHPLFPFKRAVNIAEKDRRYSTAPHDQQQSVPNTLGEGLSRIHDFQITRSQTQQKYKPELWLTPLKDIDWDMESESIPHVRPDPQIWVIDLHPTEIAGEYPSDRSHESEPTDSNRSTEDIKGDANLNIEPRDMTLQEALWKKSNVATDHLGVDSDHSLDQAKHMILETQSLARQVLGLVDKPGILSNLAADVINDCRRYATASRDTGHSGPILDRIHRNLLTLKELLIQEPGEYDQETFRKVLATCGQKLDIFPNHDTNLQVSDSKILDKANPELWLSSWEDIDWDLEGDPIPQVCPQPQNVDIDLEPLMRKIEGNKEQER